MIWKALWVGTNLSPEHTHMHIHRHAVYCTNHWAGYMIITQWRKERELAFAGEDVHGVDTCGRGIFMCDRGS